ncbi:MAG: lysine biosynthesis protein LysW [Gemmatimonadota bacterium]
MNETLECIVCGGPVSLQATPLLGELLDCRDCGSELEVVALEPAARLEEAPMAAEDWGE